MKSIVSHICIIAAGLFLCLGLPALIYLPALAGGADAVSSATLDIPDQPSGEFVVILNREKHPATLDEWSDFFLERPVGVIMEDVSCMAAAGDASGIALARRYQARLAEHQLKLAEENGLLVVSRAENGLFDVIVLSKEAAEFYDFSAVYAQTDALLLTVEGGT